MPRPTIITLSDEDKQYLLSLSKCRTIQAQVVDRARILLQKEQGINNRDIASGLNININTFSLCLKKFHEGGIDVALFDKPRTGRPAEITSDAVAWIINIACQRPADIGYAQELWTLKNLHQHIQNHAEEAGYPRLTNITKARVQQILKQFDIKPFKIKYYCEKRDADFETKMHEVLLVYKQIELQFDKEGKIIVPENGVLTVTLSYDEKPGIQAVANTTDDLHPTSQNGMVYRDSEYKRLGTLSLLAAIDLLTGEAIPLVSDIVNIA